MVTVITAVCAYMPLASGRHANIPIRLVMPSMLLFVGMVFAAAEWRRR